MRGNKDYGYKILPCDIGDTIYIIIRSGYIFVPYKTIVKSIKKENFYGDLGYIISTEFGNQIVNTEYELNSNVFLSEEQARAEINKSQ